MLFRPHRELLADAMADVVEIPATMEALRGQLKYVDEYMPQGWTVVARPYGFDSRIGWDTYLISVPGYGVVGFTNEMPKEIPK